MIDYENSFSLAICEYYSNSTISKEDNAVKKQYEISKSTWIELIFLLSSSCYHLFLFATYMSFYIIRHKCRQNFLFYWFYRRKSFYNFSQVFIESGKNS